MSEVDVIRELSDMVDLSFVAQVNEEGKVQMVKKKKP